MKVSESGSSIGKSVDIGGPDLSAVCTHVRKAKVVRDDDEEVWAFHHGG